MVEQKTPTINIEKLVEFQNNIFAPYEGQRMDDLVASIAEHGILSPITVRPLDGNKFQILSGHNRYRAAKQLKLIEIPCNIKDVSDDEAALIVTESNLIQRSFNDLKHSERAVILRNHLEYMKKYAGQGKRTDLSEGTQNELIDLLDEGAQVAHKLKSPDKVAGQYALSKDTVSRYVRLAKLPSSMLRMVDDGVLKFIPAIELSWLSETELDLLVNIINQRKIKITLNKAVLIRVASKEANGQLPESEIIKILTSNNRRIKPVRINLSADVSNRFEKLNVKTDEAIVNIITLYFDMLEKGEIKDVINPPN